MPAGRQERKGSAGRMAHSCARQSCSVVASPRTGGPIACPGLCCRSMEMAAPCAAHGKVLAEAFARHGTQLLRLGEDAAAETAKAAEKARGWLQLLHFTTALGGQTEVSERSENI